MVGLTSSGRRKERRRENNPISYTNDSHGMLQEISQRGTKNFVYFLDSPANNFNEMTSADSVRCVHLWFLPVKVRRLRPKERVWLASAPRAIDTGKRPASISIRPALNVDEAFYM
jgi:hypothetical protein